jgi:hypothetical protein
MAYDSDDGQVDQVFQVSTCRQQGVDERFLDANVTASDAGGVVFQYQDQGEDVQTSM